MNTAAILTLVLTFLFCILLGFAFETFFMLRGITLTRREKSIFIIPVAVGCFFLARHIAGGLN